MLKEVLCNSKLMAQQGQRNTNLSLFIILDSNNDDAYSKRQARFLYYIFFISLLLENLETF